MLHASLLLLLALSAAGLCAATSPLNMLLTLDCQGTIHLPMDTSFQVPSLPDLFTTIQDDMIAKAKDQCSSITSDEIDNYFSLPQALLYYLSGNSPAIPNCPNIKSIAQAIQGANTLSLNLPTTCTAAGYAANGCSVALNIPNNGGTVNLLMTQCPSSAMPFIQVTASGTAIDQLLMPCASNSDCTANGFSCVNPIANVDTSFFTNWLTTAGYSTTCASFQSFINSFVSGFWSAQYGQTSTPSTTTTATVCMPPDLFTSATALQPFEPTCTTTVIGASTIVSCPFAAGITSVSSLSSNDLNGRNFQVPLMPDCAGTMSMSCGGTINAFFGRKFGTTANFGFLPSLETMLVSFFQSATMSASGTCGVSSGSAALSSFWLNYAPWSFSSYLARFTGQPNLATVAGSPLSQLYSQMGSPIVTLPSSCTYQTFMSTGTCKIMFTGLTSLLMTTPGTDVFLEIDQCPDTQIPSFDIQLTSPVVVMLDDPQSCTESSTCSGGLVCTNLTAEDPGISTADAYQWMSPSGSSLYPGSAFQLTMNYIMGSEGVRYGYSYCTPSVTAVSNNFAAWQQSEVVTSGGVNTYGLKDATSYSSFQCPADQIALASSLSPSSLWMLLLALAMLACNL